MKQILVPLVVFCAILAGLIFMVYWYSRKETFVVSGDFSFTRYGNTIIDEATWTDLYWTLAMRLGISGQFFIDHFLTDTSVDKKPILHINGKQFIYQGKNNVNEIYTWFITHMNNEDPTGSKVKLSRKSLHIHQMNFDDVGLESLRKKIPNDLPIVVETEWWHRRGTVTIQINNGWTDGATLEWRLRNGGTGDVFNENTIKEIAKWVKDELSLYKK